MRLNAHPKTKTVQITDETRRYAEKKLAKLGKHFRHEPEAQLIQGFERGQHVVEVTLSGDDIQLRSQERHGDLHAAVDGVVDKLETQLKRFKGKRVQAHRRPSAIKQEAEAAITEVDIDAFAPRIVRRKAFALRSMSAEEAAHQMELLGHSFFVFLDEDTNRIGVLYKRHGGDYGLIEPKIT
ncbi:MAG TPA: ribosome-associated translation inhibitor RaiA [Chthonomonadaceae bacterium]|nr:ribosome-associated translation inhibitor RaiA [Chthonomonadaceae bacterium]